MNTVIKLYECWKCLAIMDESDTERPEAPCKCGSRMLRPAHPTMRNIVRYFLRKPAMLLRFIREAVC